MKLPKSGKAQFRFTCNQNIIISDILPEDKNEIESYPSTIWRNTMSQKQHRLFAAMRLLV